MSARVLLEPVFVLHKRAYRNTSLIVELFSKNHGRLTAVARSARGLRSRYKGKLQLFSPLLVNWYGLNELKTLGDAELTGMPAQFDGEALYCGFYLNELLLRLLQREDPCPQLFILYEETLFALQQADQFPQILRRFEKRLLDYLGYGLSLTREACTGQPIQADAQYQFIPEQGFLRCHAPTSHQALVFSGHYLLAFDQEQWITEQMLQEAKRLMRMCLSYHLGNRPLKSRELFGT